MESVPIQGLIYKGGAVNRQNLDEIRFLESIGSDINLRCIEPTNSGRSILLDAAKKGRIEIFGLLLNLGADPDIRCNRGKTLGDYIREDYEEKFDYNVKNPGTEK